MKIIKYLLLAVLFCNLFSCVEDEVVFREKADTISFKRNLYSVAKDETPSVKVEIKKIDGTDNSALYNIVYKSTDNDVFTIDKEGVLTPGSNSLGKKASVLVEATLKNTEEAEPLELSPLAPDTIEIGLVTISDNEAQEIKKDEILDLNKIVTEGYDPRGEINNKVSKIDVNLKEMVLTATFFDFKNKDLDEPILVWNSNKPEIIEIDETGKLTPITEGSAIITVSAIIDGETIVAPPLMIEVANETVIVDQPKEEEEEIIGFGTLMTNSSYNVEGTFRIVKEDGETKLVLSDDFKTDGLPDLVIYLSNSTTSNTGAIVVSDAIISSGPQTFVIPDDINVNNYRNVLLYCRRFSQRVGFGVISK